MLSLTNDVLTITLPEGKTNAELLVMMKGELKDLNEKFFGKEIKITGRITTHLALLLGHELAHICKSVSLFDPKLNTYVLVLSH